MAVNRAVVGPREMWLDHLQGNPSSFSTTANQTFDDFNLQCGRHNLSPARVAAGQTMAHDLTAYTTIPVEESWQQRFRSNLSPAGVTAVGAGKLHEGQLT